MRFANGAIVAALRLKLRLSMVDEVADITPELCTIESQLAANVAAVAQSGQGDTQLPRQTEVATEYTACPRAAVGGEVLG